MFQNTIFTPKIWYEDLDFFYRAFCKVDRIAVATGIVYVYRENPQSFLHKFSTGRLDALKVTERLETFIKAHLPALLPAARDRRLSANFNMYALLSRNASSNNFVEHKQSCWKLICAYRMECLLNPKTRLKNKLGVLLSFFGKNAFTLISRILY